MRRRADFDRVFQQGRQHSGRLMALRSVATEQALTRYAYAISKRVGNAVVRNKIRRRLRELLRALPLLEGFDIVISVRQDAARASFSDLQKELTTLSGRSKLLQTAPAQQRELPAP